MKYKASLELEASRSQRTKPHGGGIKGSVSTPSQKDGSHKIGGCLEGKKDRAGMVTKEEGKLRHTHGCFPRGVPSAWNLVSLSLTIELMFVLQSPV